MVSHISFDLKLYSLLQSTSCLQPSAVIYKRGAGERTPGVLFDSGMSGLLPACHFGGFQATCFEAIRQWSAGAVAGTWHGRVLG